MTFLNNSRIQDLFIRNAKFSHSLLLAIFLVSCSSESSLGKNDVEARAKCKHPAPLSNPKGEPQKTKSVNQPRLPMNTHFAAVSGEIAATSTVPSTEVGMKILLMSATGNESIEPSVGAARKTLKSMGIPFDEAVLTQNGVRLSTALLSLEEAPGKGKYYGVVLSTGQLAYVTNTGTWERGLTDEQWAQLATYEQAYGARHVALYSYPFPELGVAIEAGYENGGGAANSLSLTSEATLADPSLNPSLSVNLSGIWHYPVKITNSGAAKPFLNYSVPSQSVAGIVNTLADGREQLSFFFDQATWSMHSSVVGNAWANWVTKGLYVGERRIYLSAQVDDLFLTTEMWDPAKNMNSQDGTRTYRTTPTDLEHFVQWQTNFKTSLPLGSTYLTEMAFNGIGVDDRATLPDSQSLYDKSRSYIDNFLWVSHTYSHLNLNQLSYEVVASEVVKNRTFANQFFTNNLSKFSTASVVTPEISGLFSSNAIRAMLENGIKSVVGDNSRAELKAANPYEGLYTTVAKNNYDGLYIVPRNATEIYYDTSTPEELVSEYNARYATFWGRSLTFSEIVNLESEKAARELLAFKHDSFMFHQTNLRSFDLPNAPRNSLVGHWLDSVAKETTRYSRLPILTEGLDKLAEISVARTKLNGCGVTAKMKLISRKSTSISAISTGNCVLPITGISYSNATSRTEKYGTDRTSWVTMTPSAEKIIPIK